MDRGTSLFVSPSSKSMSKVPSPLSLLMVPTEEVGEEVGEEREERGGSRERNVSGAGEAKACA
jgi:hypothetical protein